MERKKWAFVNLAVWSVAAVILLVILLLGLNGRFYGFNFGWGGMQIGSTTSFYRYPDADKYTPGGAEIDGSQVKDLDIDWIAGDITVEVYDGETVQFSEVSARELSAETQLYYYNKNGRLMIKYYKSGQKTFWSHQDLDKELTVKIPRETAKALGYVGVDTISSHATVSELTAEEIYMDSTSGSMEVFDSQSRKLTMESTSGNLNGKNLNISGTLHADTTSGSVNVAGSIQNINFDTVSGELTVTSDVCPDQVKTDAVSGNISLTIPDNDGFTYDTDTVSGRITCEFETSYSKNRGVYKNGAAKFDFESVSGDFQIKRIK